MQGKEHRKTGLHWTLDGFQSAEPAPTLVLMHFLGGSTREWDEVVQRLRNEHLLLRIDLPGFGESAEVPGYSVEEMADAVEDTLETARQTAGVGSYVLVGHSMSGKVAMVLARRSQNAGDNSLAGLVLVAPSPPSPEPFEGDKRERMIALLGTRGEDDLRRAHGYISKNGERTFADDVHRRADSEVLRMNRAAWTAWLEHGSREDWTRFVGVLDLPVVVVAGEDDSSLGAAQQRRLTLPHLSHGRMEVLPRTSHLIPMERPEEMAGVLRRFLEELTRPSQGPVVPAEYLDLIASDRVSAPTRKVLEERIAGPAAAEGILTEAQERTLRAMVARIVPQDGENAIDLAGFIVARLAKGTGDGWRYDVLPPDLQAYREGLDRLVAKGLADLPGAEQDEVLRELEDEPTSGPGRWFEDVRAAAVETWIAHPATLARIGYSGIGVGGARTPHKGFALLRANEREAWEPQESARVRNEMAVEKDEPALELKGTGR